MYIFIIHTPINEHLGCSLSYLLGIDQQKTRLCKYLCRMEYKVHKSCKTGRSIVNFHFLKKAQPLQSWKSTLNLHKYGPITTQDLDRGGDQSTLGLTAKLLVNKFREEGFIAFIHIPIGDSTILHWQSQSNCHTDGLG